MEKYAFFVIRLCIVGLLLESGRIVAGSVDPWRDIKSLELLDGEGFKRVVDPLMKMTANAYRYPDVIPVQDWTLLEAVAPIHGGMHALVYKCSNISDPSTKKDCLSGSTSMFSNHCRSSVGSRDWFAGTKEVCRLRGLVTEKVIGRMVLAFRGTDISGSQSSRADVCVDYVYWIDFKVSILEPRNCSEFNSDTLDYYKQAVDYTRQMLEAHPQASFLLTGHSLGAGLAILTSATFGSTPLLPVVAFSAPGTKAILERFGLKLTSGHDENLYIIADKWDDIVRTSWEYQIGTLCLYETTITQNCIACLEATVSSEDFYTFLAVPKTEPHTPSIIQTSTFTDENFKERYLETEVDPDDMPCSRCFYETHYFQHVVDLVELGNKPQVQILGFQRNSNLCQPLKGNIISDL